ncbi:hypothetical protein ABBQ32_007948 [Trebouxia sp. C0010 RCD-2024]
MLQVKKVILGTLATLRHFDIAAAGLYLSDNCKLTVQGLCSDTRSQRSALDESWNEVDVDNTADKAEVKRQVLHDGSFADPPELRPLSDGGAWRKWKNCQTFPPGNLKVKVISLQPGAAEGQRAFAVHVASPDQVFHSATMQPVQGIGKDGYLAHKDEWTIQTFNTSPVQLIVGPNQVSGSSKQ